MSRVKAMFAAQIMQDHCMEYLKDAIPTSALYQKNCKIMDENDSWYEIQSAYQPGILEETQVNPNGINYNTNYNLFIIVTDWHGSMELLKLQIGRKLDHNLVTTFKSQNWRK